MKEDDPVPMTPVLQRRGWYHERQLQKEKNEQEDEAVRKRQRHHKRQESLSPNDVIGTNSQWLFQQHCSSSSQNNNGNNHNRKNNQVIPKDNMVVFGSMVLSDNLGDVSELIDSMTQEVDNWSLTNTHHNNNNTTAQKGSRSNASKKQRSKNARREIMRTLLQPNHQPTNNERG